MCLGLRGESLGKSLRGNRGLVALRQVTDMPAYYRTSLQEFLKDDTSRILGVIHKRSAVSGFTDLKESQSRAWLVQLDALKRAAAELLADYPDAVNWGILFEYPIPRRQKRIDVVLLTRDIVLCLEFKTGETKHQKSTSRQVEDYALDLRDFHEGSRGRVIVPIAVTVRGNRTGLEFAWDHDDLAKPVVRACSEDLTEKLAACVDQYSTSLEQIESAEWENAAYKPVPTIIEAAEALYAGHDVREIARSHADAQNLGETSERLIELIQEAKSSRSKIICIVTGVPGAGKTLAGLNVAHDPSVRALTQGVGVFLSGNGPLVRIVSAAIAKDFKKKKGSRDGERTVSTFIQNVHSFIQDALPRSGPPNEHLIIFDEAQRAWDAEQCAKKIDKPESEPELILSIMDRHPDWGVIVALVGGGQEINTGEAGLSEWGRALQTRFPHWNVAVSPNSLKSGQLDRMQQLFEDAPPSGIHVQAEQALHLNVSLRSYKAEAVSKWVDAVVEGDSSRARQILPHCKGFHLALTRDLVTARKWLQEHTRGERRSGLLASSGAMRLRAEGIELSSGFRQGNKKLYVDWFLNDLDDIRVSNQLEVAATEYECQGLELDLTCVCWGGDLQRKLEGGWQMRKLIGPKWISKKKVRDQRYLLNSYRVLMTRAREGMIIWVPRGSISDHTQEPSGFDRTAQFLIDSGLPEV
jgi:hypothetical protein